MIRKSIEIAEPGGPRRLSYLDWGEADNPDVVLCVHGLTRSARDFDRLAAALAEDHRVICADVAGRGESDWLKDAALYQTPTYARDMVALLDQLGVAAADWIGTSMGGIISMAVAGNADRAVAGRIRRLVINDIGPFLPKEAIARIGEYVGQTWRWDSLDEAEAHIRVAYAPFGPLTDAQWRTVTENSVTRTPEGAYVPGFDPAIGASFRDAPAVDVDMWPLWDAITCPVLVLRGEESDLLLRETATEMKTRGPGAEVVEFPGIGHAPQLLDDDQIAVVREWLARKP